MSVREGPITLETSVEVEDERLTVEFLVSNDGEEPMLVYAHPDDGQRSEIMWGTAYIMIRPNERMVVVSMIPPNPPPDLALQVGIVSLCRMLKGGGEYRGHVEVPIPIREWSPFKEEDEGAGTRRVPVDRLRFETACFPARSASWVQHGPAPGTFWAEAVRKVVLAEERALGCEVASLLSLPTNGS